MTFSRCVWRIIFSFSIFGIVSGWTSVSTAQRVTRQPVAGHASSSYPISSEDVTFLDTMGVVLPAMMAACPSDTVLRAVMGSARMQPLQGPIFATRNAPAPAMLQAMRASWTRMTMQERQWMACTSFLSYGWSDILTEAITPVVDSGWVLPRVERLLVRMVRVDTDSVHRAAPWRTNEGRRFTALAALLGMDPHRYDKAVLRDVRVRTALKLQLLAKIALREHRLAEAQRIFEHAYQLWPYLGLAPLFAAELVQRADTAAAMAWLALAQNTAMVLWSPQQDVATRLKLEQLYGATHAGSLQGLDILVRHATFRTEFGTGFDVTPWSPSQPVTTRVPLVQYETWRWCTGCAQHDVAAQALAQRYGSHVIMLEYHYGAPLVPPHWPSGVTTLKRLSTTMGGARVLTMADEHVGTDPAGCTGVWIDGTCARAIAQAQGRMGALPLYDQLVPGIDEHLAMRRDIRIAVHVQLIENRVVTHITVDSLQRRHPSPLKLQVVLAEDSIPLPGYNHTPFQLNVVRAIAGDSATGYGYTLIPQVAAQTIVNTIDLVRLSSALRATNEPLHEREQADWRRPGDPVVPLTPLSYTLDRRQLWIVAYVQDQKTGEILQSTRAQVCPSCH